MYFAYHKRSKPTGELLGEILQMTHGESPGRAFEAGSFAPNETVLIRWGSRASEEMDQLYDKVVNPCSAIKLCSDKIESTEAFIGWEEKTGAVINTPAYDLDPHYLIERFGYPILGRKRQHARGTDIKLILQERDLLVPSDYYSVYIPTKREYRIHVVNGEVIRVQGKFLDYPQQAVSHIRNYATGYRFRAPRKRLHSSRLTMAVEAVKSLGLDFGAVDLLVADDGLGYVLEVNTAPSCSPVTLGAYAVALHKHFDLETEIDLSPVDLVDCSIEDMDSDDEVEGEED